MLDLSFARSMCSDRARSKRGGRVVRRSVVLLAAAALIVLLAACSSTKIVNLWVDPDYGGSPFRKIAVIGISDRPGERQLFEEEFVRRLDRLGGVEAVAGTDLFEERGEIATEHIAAVVADTDIDAVLVTRLVSEEKMPRDRPEPTGSFDDYYFRGSRTIRSKGYITEDTIVRLETNLYAADSMTLVWSGTTESFNPPASIAKTIDELADIVVESLQSNGMLL